MSKILIKNAKEIITMDQEGNRFKGYSLLIEDNKISQIAKDIDVEVDEVIDASNHFVYPGLINTHHHFYQTMTRNIPQIQEAELFDWLIFLYPIWSKLTHDVIYTSSLLAMGELLKTGCTTAFDHFYVYPKGVSENLIDEQFKAAKDIGMRFHGSRGSMSLSKKDGGLPPDEVVQTVEEILKDSERVIKKYHDPNKYSMSRVILAPCSPFSVSEELMVESIKLARKFGVQSHTHLAETKDEERFCIERFGLRPLDYMKKVGWIGEDVWFAHGIYFTDDEIKYLAETKTGVAHCPVSNLKLGSGIAKIPQMLDAGVRVGLAVDGSASNDSSNMLAELNTAFLIHRVASGVTDMTAERALRIATNGGAQILNQPEIGSLEIDKAADLFMIDTRQLGYAGGLYDSVSALVATGSTQVVDITIVNGKVVVRGGKLVNIDENELFEKANRLSEEMVIPFLKK
ncbi:8-oxoguanine deaminase [bacterium]|nr:8-oxoguanine deaminase [bacterium]